MHKDKRNDYNPWRFSNQTKDLESIYSILVSDYQIIDLESHMNSHPHLDPFNDLVFMAYNKIHHVVG